MVAVFKVDCGPWAHQQARFCGQESRAPERAWTVAVAVTTSRLRRDKPMVSLELRRQSILESEMFGHMRGAFTGADSNKKGLLEAADRAPSSSRRDRRDESVMRVKLRVLQERRFRRVGGLKTNCSRHPRDCRHRQNLEGGGPAFRRPLHRINVISVSLPPLRERRRTSHPRRTLLKITQSRWKNRSARLRVQQWTCCRGTTGQATFANSKTSSNVPLRSEGSRCSPRPAACCARRHGSIAVHQVWAQRRCPAGGLDLEARQEIRRASNAGARARERRQVKAADCWA